MTALPLRRAALAAALALAAAWPGAARAQQQRGPSTAEERKRAVQTTRRLEKDPLAKGAEADRKWLFEWIVAIPDISVTSCDGPLTVLLGDEEGERHGRELYLQAVFGMTAFLVENPKKKEDWVAVQTAGIASTLAAYERLVKARPKERWPELDELVAARKKGKLAQVVEEDVDCSGEPRPPLDETI
jgi:hypothetical protein